MISVFLYAFHAIAPILILILLGYSLKSRSVFSDGFFRKMNTFVFRYCFPFLMFENLYKMESIRDADFKLALFLVGSIGILTVLAIVITNRVTREASRKGVMIQAGFRSNFALIGLPLSEGLTGQSGLLVTTSMQAPVVIYFNVFSVLFLAIYSEDAKFSVRKVLRSTVRNPLLQGLFAGLIALLIREVIPVSPDGVPVFTLERSLPWLYKVISYLARVATPVALISLGGQFQFSKITGMRKELTASVLMRLILAPAVGFALAFSARAAGWIEMSPAVVGMLIACFGSPLAVSSVPMAAEMGADADLAGQIVVWTSLFSMLSIFLLTVLCRAGGLL